jgi:hypothetical protein
MLNVARDEVAERGEDVEADLLPLAELHPQDAGDALEAGGEVGGRGAEAGEQGPQLVGYHRVGLLAHGVLLPRAGQGPVQALGRQGEEILGEEAQLSGGDVVPRNPKYYTSQEYWRTNPTL